MRSWRSNLFLPASVIREADRNLRQKHGVDYGSSLWPSCEVCSARLHVRFAVEAVEVADRGHAVGGEPYTDIRARCHGEEDVVRIEGMRWDMARDGKQNDLIRVSAIAAIPFFVVGDKNRTIPAKVFRAFVGAH